MEKDFDLLKENVDYFENKFKAFCFQEFHISFQLSWKEEAIVKDKLKNLEQIVINAVKTLN